MPISRLDVITAARSILREKTSDSFDPTDLTIFFKIAYRKWAQELLWPEATWWASTTIGAGPNIGIPTTAQEYQLPEGVNRIYRTYLNGNRCIPTSIPILEGDVRQIFNPIWKLLPATDPSNMTTPLPTSTGGSIPITAGPLPTGIKYYLRGGWIGFVPGPKSVGLPIQVDGVAIPQDPRDDNEPIAFPPQFLDGLALETAHIALVSDDRAQLAGGVKALADEQLQLARRWRRNLQGDMTLTVQAYDYRGYWGTGGPIRSIKVNI